MRDHDPPPWTEAVGAIVVLGLLASIALVAIAGLPWFLSFLAGSASGWAQAIGATAAIFAAAKIGRSQIEASQALERARRAQDELRRLATIDALLSNGEWLCNWFIDAWVRSNFLPKSYSVNYWADCKSAIVRVDPFMCPSPEVVVHLVHLPRQLDILIAAQMEFHRRFEKRKQEILLAGDQPPDFLAAKREFDKQLVETRAMFKQTRAECATTTAKLQKVLGG